MELTSPTPGANARESVGGAVSRETPQCRAFQIVGLASLRLSLPPPDGDPILPTRSRPSRAASFFRPLPPPFPNLPSFPPFPALSFRVRAKPEFPAFHPRGARGGSRAKAARPFPLSFSPRHSGEAEAELSAPSPPPSLPHGFCPQCRQLAAVARGALPVFYEI